MATDNKIEDNSISELRDAVGELTRAVSFVRDQLGVWQLPQPSITLPAESSGWNFTTFEKYINQRFGDMSLQLRERYEAQQTGVTAALAAAEKAVTAALIAAEKAVDKAERAQELRNQVANEFRSSLQDLSSLMWTIKEGTAAVDSLRREVTAAQDNLEKKIGSLDSTKSDALDQVRRALEGRVGNLETGYANIQGRIWAVSALFAIVTLALTFGSKFIGH